MIDDDTLRLRYMTLVSDVKGVRKYPKQILHHMNLKEQSESVGYGSGGQHIRWGGS